MQCPIEDRIAIQDLMISYAHAVDTISDIDAVCDVFTPDAVFDLSGIGLTPQVGHEGIRAFFNNVFANMANHAHYLTNFALTSYDGDTASMRAYVIGMGVGKDGSTVTVNGRYFFDVRRTDAESHRGWKATRYTMDFLMPLSGTLENAK